MRIAIVGGTGTLGGNVVAELSRRGHEIRVLSRASTDFPVDLVSGDGLAAALDGCVAVIDASNATSPKRARQVLVEGSRKLLAAEQAAGVGHHVGVSIVGCDRVPIGYYRVKTEQEQVIEQAPVPWSLVCATQFHELAAAALAAAAKYRVLPVPRMQLQTVAAAEVARVIAEVTEAGPARRRIQVAGPEITSAAQLARTWRSATGRHAVMIGVPVPGKLGRALRDGALTADNPEVRGTTTFAEWLRRGSRQGR